jgi:sugar lactone lactonase YvrE
MVDQQWLTEDTCPLYRVKGGEMQMTGILRRAFTAVMSLLLVALVAALAMPAAAAPAEVIVLPGASSAEGIANGGGTTFYAGDLFTGDIFRGDVQRGTAQLFIDVPGGRMAVGMVAALDHDLLFVAGGFTGQGYVYNTVTGATVATYQFGAADTSLINDVALTKDGAWFTDSFQPRLYFVPVNEAGVPGSFVTLELTGPAAEISGQFNLNGIQATPNGKTLIVAHSTNGELYTVDPVSGTSSTIAGVSVPSVDGIVLLGRRLWAVQNSNQVTRVQLNAHLTSGVIEEVITSDLFQVPTTAARFGSRLAVVNAKFDTGFPPTADQYEVFVVDR